MLFIRKYLFVVSRCSTTTLIKKILMTKNIRICDFNKDKKHLQNKINFKRRFQKKFYFFFKKKHLTKSFFRVFTLLNFSLFFFLNNMRKLLNFFLVFKYEIYK